MPVDFVRRGICPFQMRRHRHWRHTVGTHAVCTPDLPVEAHRPTEVCQCHHPTPTGACRMSTRAGLDPAYFALCVPSWDASKAPCVALYLTSHRLHFCSKPVPRTSYLKLEVEVSSCTFLRRQKAFPWEVPQWGRFSPKIGQCCTTSHRRAPCSR